MKTKRVLMVVSILALILVVALISVRAYYLAIALVIGTLIMGHREIWSILRTKKLPPIDERIRENTGKSIRNGFIFFALVSAFLMLFFSLNLNTNPETVHVLGGVFISSGMAYLISYLFYDRAEPRLSERGLKMMKVFLIVTGIALAVFILSAFLHNAISGLFDIEEPVFFFIAVFIAPLAFAVGLVGSLVIFIRGLLS
ncbi:MAG: hypothetical protein JSW16_05305 [Dehalococcoidales bacterium]|nr:MAG: hypothetical protein JSW16_05305 [Dehalococcoidales bacterium]